MEPFFKVFFVIVGIFIIYCIFRMIFRYIKNEKSPIINTKARLFDKVTEGHGNTGANGTTISFYLVYELDTGSKMKFPVSGKVYKTAQNHEWGKLTFQGTRFIKFESTSGVIEK